MARLCAANEIEGSVCSIREHALHATLAVSVGQSIVRVDVPMGPVRHARVAEDDRVLLSFKSSDVILGDSQRTLPVSIASQVPGTVVSVDVDETDAVALVEVEVAPGVLLAADVDADFLDELGVVVGGRVMALITACDVMPMETA